MKDLLADDKELIDSEKISEAATEQDIDDLVHNTAGETQPDVTNEIDGDELIHAMPPPPPSPMQDPDDAVHESITGEQLTDARIPPDLSSRQ